MPYVPSRSRGSDRAPAHPAPIVPKPFDAEQLLAAARRLLAAEGGTDSAA